ncbi:NINE protein [Pantanalinema rosaneae CENA516]|uniref:NINE protein n=1 Tax=Pantanalinema rosaneae TaxID=1620701 RepID=UPI003D6FFF3A
MKGTKALEQHPGHRMNNVGTAYVLWLGCLLQLHGLQRLYNGKIFTGLLWMFTFGLFGFGQLLDLVLIPGMVDEHNTKLRSRQGLPPHLSPNQPVVQRVLSQDDVLPLQPPTAQVQPNQLTIQLVKAAAARGGKLSVTQGVLDTEAGFPEVELALKNLLKTGYVDLTNDPETGVVMYEFREL